MSPTSTIPPTHVPCASEWPALSPSKIPSHDHYDADADWELLTEPQDGSPQTSFERDAVRIVEPNQSELKGTSNDVSTNKTTAEKLFCLKHAESTPNFHTIVEESDDDVEAILIGNNSDEDGVGSIASSSMVMVSGPPSVVSAQSGWSSSSKVSFRDAIMKEKAKTDDDLPELFAKQAPKAMKIKPKFVVKPIKRCAKSMVDLRSLERILENGHDDMYNNDMVVGDTDAQLFYNRKSKGMIGRANGRKTRPDEAKRLQITMAKKEDQRQRQQAAANKKRG